VPLSGKINGTLFKRQLRSLPQDLSVHFLHIGRTRHASLQLDGLLMDLQPQFLLAVLRHADLVAFRNTWQAAGREKPSKLLAFIFNGLANTFSAAWSLRTHDTINSCSTWAVTRALWNPFAAGCLADFT
jgi:hypothetical protein